MNHHSRCLQCASSGIIKKINEVRESQTRDTSFAGYIAHPTELPTLLSQYFTMSPGRTLENNKHVKSARIELATHP